MSAKRVVRSAGVRGEKGGEFSAFVVRKRLHEGTGMAQMSFCSSAMASPAGLGCTHDPFLEWGPILSTRRREDLNTKLLIDAIVRQTTVLVAQLSTAAGIRAPLSHVIDHVFLDLSREIERQGLSRKVAADMFGLALRSYQKKVQRLTESETESNRTLWQSILEHLQDHPNATRQEIENRFKFDGSVVVGSVLNDLGNSGLISRTGAGDCAIYRITHPEELQKFISQSDVESATAIVWATIYRNPGISEEMLLTQLGLDPKTLSTVLDQLQTQTHIEGTGTGTPGYTARTLTVPVDSSCGWEAAVWDHFQAVVTAIGIKLQRGAPKSGADDVIGGATLSFDVYPGHPHSERVYGLLKTVRADVNQLWSEVSEYNKEHLPPEDKSRVTFYFGQSVVEGE